MSEALLVNAYSSLRELPALDFPHQQLNARDRSDPELAPHLNGFINYVMSRGDGQMTATRYHLWRHIQRVRNQASFLVENADLAAMSAWAQRANAILFLPDGSVRNPDLEVLLAHDGESKLAPALPYPPDAVARRARSLEALRGLKPQPPTHMPPSLGEAEVELRPVTEVLHRALGLVCAAAEGIALGEGSDSMAPELREKNPAGMAALTPRENAFLTAKTPDIQEALQMGWRFEALNILLWALDSGPTAIGPADQQQEVGPLYHQAMALAQDTTAATRRRLRPTGEILDLLDLTWRQHWIVREAAQKQIALEGLDAGIVQERHHALNWLTGFQNDFGTDWDDIDTPS